jgi:hypothetical protein
MMLSLRVRKAFILDWKYKRRYPRHRWQDLVFRLVDFGIGFLDTGLKGSRLYRLESGESGLVVFGIVRP